MRHEVHRRRLLQVLALGMADLVGVAVHRGVVRLGEPDGRAEVVDVGVRQQDGAHIAGAETQLPQRRQDVVVGARKAGVDQHHARVVGDQCPVDQWRLRHVNVIGDGRERREHSASLGNLDRRARLN
jgi:hypothetical protein